MNQKSDIITAPVIAFSRHRIQSDGEGVTTLVCFHGCPLRCKLCLNPFSFSEQTKFRHTTPQDLYEQVKIDELYFLATNGGITFGGGEPLLYPDFLAQFKKICGKKWNICAETSLNVPWDNIEKAAAAIDNFIIDCKDTDPLIYKKYTGKDNSMMIDNLKELMSLVSPDRITVRVPLIPTFNTQENTAASVNFLTKLGIKHIDRYEYIIPEKRKELFT